MKTWYMVLANDGTEQSKELKTLKEARAELKDIIREDVEELGLAEGDIDYYIVKYTEDNGTIYEEEMR